MRKNKMDYEKIRIADIFCDCDAVFLILQDEKEFSKTHKIEMRKFIPFLNKYKEELL
jgi:hypothetical protein